MNDDKGGYFKINWFSDLKIAAKLIISFVFVAIISAVVGLV